MAQASAIRRFRRPHHHLSSILTLHQGHGAANLPAGVVNAEPSIEGAEIQASGNGAQVVILKSSGGIRTPLCSPVRLES